MSSNTPFSGTPDLSESLVLTRGEASYLDTLGRAAADYRDVAGKVQHDVSRDLQAFNERSVTPDTLTVMQRYAEAVATYRAVSQMAGIAKSADREEEDWEELLHAATEVADRTWIYMAYMRGLS